MIYRGKNAIKALYKGGKQLDTVHKGSELIYEDFVKKYGFKFTINTTYGSSTTPRVCICVNQNCSRSNSLQVDWGDGTSTKLSAWSGNQTTNFSSSIFGKTFSHTYDKMGTYKITITPTQLDARGVPYPGWLSGVIPWAQSNSASSPDSLCDMLVSVDTPYPEHSFIIGNPPENGYATPNLSMLFSGATHVTSTTQLPVSTFDNIEVGEPGEFNHMAYYTFCRFGSYSTNVDLTAIMKALLDKVPAEWYSGEYAYDHAFSYIVFSSPENLKGLLANYPRRESESAAYMYRSTFEGIKGRYQNYWSFTGKWFGVPEGVTNATHMFDSTFAGLLSYTMKNASFGSIFSQTFVDSNGEPYHLQNGSYMFYKTFAWGSDMTGTTKSLGVTFSGVPTSEMTNMSHMFDNTFAQTSSSKYILGGYSSSMFDSLDLSSATNCSYMFYRTFLRSMSEIPKKLLNKITPSKATDCSYMFDETFSFGDSYSSSYKFDGYQMGIPGPIFENLDTSSCQNFSYMFRKTFAGRFLGSPTTIPEGLFSGLNTSQGTNLSYMFYQTFYQFDESSAGYNPRLTGAIPANLFSSITTESAANMGYMFYQTFAHLYGDAKDAQIPDGFFRTITFDSATNLTSMFSGTFYHTYRNASSGYIGKVFPDIELSLPNGAISSMFSSAFRQTFSKASTGYIDPDIFAGFNITARGCNSLFNYTFFGAFDSGCTSMPTTFGKITVSAGNTGGLSNNMFDGTFGALGAAPELSIPKDLFKSVDWSETTNTSSMFASTFSNSGLNAYEVDADFFHGVDTPKTINLANMFSLTFANVPFKRYPKGLFRGIPAIADSTSTGNGMFYNTFAFNNSAIATLPTEEAILEDVFDGAGVFEDAYTQGTFYQMFSRYDADPNIRGSGTAIIAHFPNVTSPNVAFRNCVGLDDYYSIPENWGGPVIDKGEYGAVLYQESEADTTLSSLPIESRAQLESLTGTATGWAATFGDITLHSKEGTYPAIRGVVFGDKLGGDSIPSHFLAYCTSLNTGIFLPSFTDCPSGYTIGISFLQGCTNFNQLITISNKVVSIKGSFLYGCSAFNQPLTVPDSVTTIEAYFLYECSSFNQPIVLSKSTESIGQRFLARCTSFNQPLTLPDSLATISTNFMRESTKFNQPLAIPESVTSVGSTFLYNCNDYTSTLTVNAPAESFEANIETLGTSSGTAKMYTKGVPIDGPYAEEFLGRFYNRDNSPYRKLYLA